MVMDKTALTDFIERQLEGTDYFLVDVQISAANDIEVEIDSPQGVDIDHCVELSHSIEQEFDRDKEDYSLTVGSAGLTEPFKVRQQYEMHVGDEVEVLACDGRKYRGKLTAVDAADFTVAVPEKVRREGAKRPEQAEVDHKFAYDTIKYTKYLIQI